MKTEIKHAYPDEEIQKKLNLSASTLSKIRRCLRDQSLLGRGDRINDDILLVINRAKEYLDVGVRSWHEALKSAINDCYPSRPTPAEIKLFEAIFNDKSSDGYANTRFHEYLKEVLGENSANIYHDICEKQNSIVAFYREIGYEHIGAMLNRLMDIYIKSIVCDYDHKKSQLEQ